MIPFSAGTHLFPFFRLLCLLGFFLTTGWFYDADPYFQRAPSETVTVTAVYDGDTIKVRFSSGAEGRVRLIGVDSPELEDERERVRFFAFMAKRYAFLRLYREEVALTFGPKKKDVYGRLLAFVWTDAETLFNETLVREGFAFAYLNFPFDESLRRRFKEAEIRARNERRGLWGEEPYPVVAANRVHSWLWQIVTVEFTCERTFDRRQFRVLSAEGADFEALIPRNVLPAFLGSLDFENRRLDVTGIVEEYQGKVQIMVDTPYQLRFRESSRQGPV